MLREQRQPGAGKPVGDPRVHRFQPLDRGEQAERAALRRLDQPRIAAGERGNVALLDVGDDQHFRAAGIIERAFRFEMLGRRRAGETRRCALRRAGQPSPPRRVAEVTSTPSRRRHHRRGERLGRVEPAAVDGDVIFAPVDPLDREPVDEFGIGLAADPPEQRDPRRERFAAPREAANRAVDARPRLRIEPVRRVFEDRLEPPRQRGKRLLQAFENLARRRRGRHQRSVRLGKLGLEAVTRLLRLGAGVDGAAHLGEQRFDRPERRAFDQPLQPAL